jgi:serine/threonine-protein kinase
MVLKLFNKDKIYSPYQKIDEYTVLEILGEGRYGICYLVHKDEKRYIIKQFKKGMLKKIGYKAKFEEEILRAIQHDSIPKFIRRIEYDEFLGCLLEFKEGKTFENIIFKDNYVFEREEIYSVAMQLINILKYLHSEGVVHRDIRVPNTIYKQGKVYLVDFGLSRWINKKRYTVDVDFSYFGDFLIHLYYTSFEVKDNKEKPWYNELDLSKEELVFLKRLLGIEEKYKNINEVEKDFLSLRNF